MENTGLSEGYYFMLSLSWPYLDAGTLYQDVIQRLYGQLGSFQDFILYTEMWLQEHQDFLTLALQAQTAREGAGNRVPLNYSGQSHQNGCPCCAGLDSDHKLSFEVESPHAGPGFSENNLKFVT